jgi:hypothetical protein
VQQDDRDGGREKAIRLTWIRICGHFQGTIFFLVEEQEEDEGDDGVPHLAIVTRTNLSGRRSTKADVLDFVSSSSANEKGVK